MILRTRSNELAPGTQRFPAEIGDAVAEMMRRHRIPGLSMAVVDGDRLLGAAAFGEADSAQGVPARPDTTYLWFSMSKLVTATAAVRLADEGRLDLDAPAHEYVDYLRPAVGTGASTRQLLNHTAGLANPLPIRWVRPATPTVAGSSRGTNTDLDRGTETNAGLSGSDLLRRLMARRRIYRWQPGGPARYSNVGYLAVGEVIAAAADLPFEQYVQRAVLDPAGMTRTGYRYPRDTESATGYVRLPRVASPMLRCLLPAGVVGTWRRGFLGLNPFYVTGAAYGGLVGDVLDAGRFLRLHLRDGELDGTRVLAPTTARAMRSIDRAGRRFDHGLGWFRRPTAHPQGGARGEYVEHFGAGAGFWNVMRLYPDRGLGVVVMANTTAAYDFEEVFARTVAHQWA